MSRRAYRYTVGESICNTSGDDYDSFAALFNEENWNVNGQAFGTIRKCDVEEQIEDTEFNSKESIEYFKELLKQFKEGEEEIDIIIF